MTTRAVGGAGPGASRLEPVVSGVTEPAAGKTNTTAKRREPNGVSGGNTVVTAPPPPPRGSSARPAEVPTGTMEYYRQRLNDFLSRNPGVPPPPYYLDYGDRYVQAFSALGPNDLTHEGLAWRDRTLKNLQEAMETLRRDKPDKFATLECDPKGFEEFAYETHAPAYLKAGLLDLPAQDLIQIVTVPALQDLLKKEGLQQIFEVIERVRPGDVQDIMSATRKEAVRQGLQPLQDLLFELNRGFSGMVGNPGAAW